MMASYHNDSQFTIEENILKGREVSRPEDHTSLGEFVLGRLKGSPDLVGQIDAVTDEEYTYENMRERSVRCALWMKSQGLRPKDLVALCSDDHLDFAMPCFAALYLGAVFCSMAVPVNTEDCAQEMSVIKPKMLFVSEGSIPFVTEAAQKVKPDVKIIVFGRAPGFLEFDSIIAEPGIDEVEKFVCAPIGSSDEIAGVIFSSGTTGDPKGVALSHRALTLLMGQAGTLGMTGKVCFVYGTPDWITMIESIFMTLWLKIPRILVPEFEERAACAQIEKYKANWVFLSPHMIGKLVTCDAVARHDLSSLSQVLYSGSDISMASYRALKKLVPNVLITSGYGMTEACGYISIQSSESRPGSCGQVVENAQVKIIDHDTGRVLGANQEGELLLKFACMMTGYYNDPLATAQCMDEEAITIHSSFQWWLHSGDIGYYDESGEIFLIGRIKDVIRFMDYDISTSTFEEVILPHPGVKEVAVVGQPQPNGDEYPIAFVVRNEDSSYIGKQVTEADIMNLVAAELRDRRKQLHAGVRFVDHLPRTSSDKIKRNVLREMAKLTGTD